MQENFTQNPKFKTLRIRNLQSLKDVTLHFTESGVFHIKGINNAGRSAVLRGLNLVSRNYNNVRYKSLLRDDADTAVVEVETYDNSRLKISRGASDYYAWNINGNEGRLDKTKGKIPTVVENYLNFYTDNEKTNECVNIRMQRERLLFVDTTASDNSYLFQKAVGTEEFLLGMKMAESKRKDLAKENKLHVASQENVQESLEEINTEYQKVTEVLDSLEKIYEVILEEFEEIQAVQEVLKLGVTYSKAVKEEREHNEKYGVVDLTEIKELAEELKELENCLNLYNKYSYYEKQLADMEESSISEEDLNEMSDLVKDLTMLQKTLKVASDFSKNHKELARISKQYNSSIDTLNDINELKADMEAINKTLILAKEYEELQSDYEIALQDYSNADEDLVTFMRENKFCPIVATTKNKQCPFMEGVIL